MTSIIYTTYQTEQDLVPAIKLIERDLSEPYSIYTYRYFVHQWPQLCILAHDSRTKECCGVIIGKLEPHRRRQLDTKFPDDLTQLERGYIGMVAVGKRYRKQGIGSTLVSKILEAMQGMGAQEVALETETSNLGALSLYESMGFIRDKHLHKYYLGGSSAHRLKYWF